MTDSDGSTGFVELRFCGGRYARRGAAQPVGMPLETIDELRRYYQALQDVATALFRRDHPNKRLPWGFTSKLDLRVTGFERGSVTTVLERYENTVRGSEKLLDLPDYHELAQENIEQTISQLAATGQLPAFFPESAVPTLRGFGRSFSRDEYAEFWRAGKQITTFTQETRTQLLGSNDTLESEELLTGHLVALDSHNKTFSIKLPETGRRPLKGNFLDEETFNSLNPFLVYKERGPLVSLSVLADKERGGNVIHIRNIQGVEAALPEKQAKRLAELSDLSEGWLNGTGSPISEEALDRAEKLLLVLLDSQMTMPYIYPTPTGGLQFEWTPDEDTVELEIDPLGQAQLYIFTDGGDEIVRPLIWTDSGVDMEMGELQGFIGATDA